MFARWHIILRILNGSFRPSVANAASGRIQIDASKESGEFGGRHLNAIGRNGWNAEGSAFETFDPGITLPSSLWRYTNSVWCRCLSPSIPIVRYGLLE
jgi:hypothetical protein